MKLGRMILVGVIAFFGVSIAKANAQVVDFNISANYSWGLDMVHSSLKQNENRYTAIGWNFSNKSSHKMWFRVVDSAERQIGSAGLFNYKTTDAIQSNLSIGQNYWLSARRENVIDPVTTVSGTWNA